MRTVKVYPESWPLHSAFIIARSARHEAGVVVVELEETARRGSENARHMRVTVKPKPQCWLKSRYCYRRLSRG